MDFVTFSSTVYVLFVFLILPFVPITLFWVVFVVVRLFKFVRNYRKLNSNIYRDTTSLPITLFNYKIKIVIYSFFLFLVFFEFVAVISHVFAMVFFNFLPHNVTDYHENCLYPFYDLWQNEFTHVSVRISIALRDFSLSMLFVFCIGLMKFIYLAYQLKTDFRNVKTYLLTYSLILPIIPILSIFPQTLVLAQLTTTFFSILLTVQLFKHKKLYFLVLKWRCDDSRNQGDDEGYKSNLKVRRNSVIAFNMFVLAFTIISIFLVLNKTASFGLMLFTDQSRYLTAVFHSDLNLSLLDCKYQKIFYVIHYLLDLAEPTAVLIAFIIYSIPLFGVTLGYLAVSLYRQCNGVDKKYILFEGNARSLSN